MKKRDLDRTGADIELEEKFVIGTRESLPGLDDVEEIEGVHAALRAYRAAIQKATDPSEVVLFQVLEDDSYQPRFNLMQEVANERLLTGDDEFPLPYNDAENMDPFGDSQWSDNELS